MVAAAVVGGAVVGGLASKSAANKQADAAENAAEMQQQTAEMTREDLSPYREAGVNAINPLLAAMGYTVGPNGKMTLNPKAALQQKFNFDPSKVAQTPGYQFALQQGLRGVQNQMANRGLGLSGAQLKGAESFATGLADQTYGQQYDRALSQFNTNYQVAANNVNNLQNLVNTGQNSAAQTGQLGQAAANNAGNYLTQAGNAQASGLIGMGNAANQGVNNYMLYNALYKQPQQQGFGTQVGNYLTS